MPNIFISYDRENKAAAKILANEVTGLGHKTWVDLDVVGGRDWWEYNLKKIRECDVFIYTLNAEALNSIICKREYHYADKLGKPILPVLVDDRVHVLFLPPVLKKIPFVDFRKRDSEKISKLDLALKNIPIVNILPNIPPGAPDIPPSFADAQGRKFKPDTSDDWVPREAVTHDTPSLFEEKNAAEKAEVHEETKTIESLELQLATEGRNEVSESDEATAIEARDVNKPDDERPKPDSFEEAASSVAADEDSGDELLEIDSVGERAAENAAVVAGEKAAAVEESELQKLAELREKVDSIGEAGELDAVIDREDVETIRVTDATEEADAIKETAPVMEVETTEPAARAEQAAEEYEDEDYEEVVEEYEADEYEDDFEDYEEEPLVTSPRSAAYEPEFTLANTSPSRFSLPLLLIVTVVVLAIGALGIVGWMNLSSSPGAADVNQNSESGANQSNMNANSNMFENDLNANTDVNANAANSEVANAMNENAALPLPVPTFTPRPVPTRAATPAPTPTIAATPSPAGGADPGTNLKTPAPKPTPKKAAAPVPTPQPKPGNSNSQGKV